MALAPGSRLGPYEIITAIGAGGMGEVYRARDTKLNRDVAVKVLLSAVANDPDRLARFRREAQVLASLNHPNIGAIYGLEESGTVPALVLELIEGATLADRIARGPLPCAEALPIARQIADALDAAHEQAVIHRDLKPANIKLRADGTVKVLDFGLAKALDRAAGRSSSESDSHETIAVPTLTSPALMTGIGTLLGTAAYMSPEQARGFPVDRRADVWAFGCVLYEMLTGRQTFSGPTVTDLVAAILEREPAFDRVPESTPPSVRRLLRRCLEKDLRKRLQNIGDARLDLDDVLAGRDDKPAAVATRGWNPASAIGALLVAAAVGAVLGWTLKRPPAAPVGRQSLVRLVIAPAEPLADAEEAVAFSPDGHRIAYIAGANRRIYVRELDQFDSTPVAGTDGADGVVFSPDGQSVAFLADRKLKTVALAGGSPLILRDSVLGRGLDWRADGSILFNPGTSMGVWRVRPGNETTDTLTKPDPHEDQHRFPRGLPGDRAVLYSGFSGGGLAEDQIFGHVLDSGQRHPLVKGVGAQYLPTGHLAYVRSGSLYAVPFDPATLQVNGSPVAVLDGVRQSANGTPHISISRDGAIVYVSGKPAPRQRTLVWVDRQGLERPLAVSDWPVAQPRLSADGRRVLVVARGDPDVWQLDLTREAWTRLTFDANTSFPLWTPDGRQLTFSSGKAGPYTIYRKTLDGSGSEERLFVAAGSSYPLAWSPDGRTLAFVTTNPETAQDILLLDTAAPSQPRVWLQTPFREGAPVFSPDGRWVAYASDASGRPEIYVRPLAGAGETVNVSSGGGVEPTWPRNSRELFFRRGAAMMAVEVSTSPSLSAGKPRQLFEGPYDRSTALWSNYDVDSQGQRFLMIRGDGGAVAPAEIRVVINWFAELQQRVPTR
jgi:eukaryotic-like serine/threonine-protein kinase